MSCMSTNLGIVIDGLNGRDSKSIPNSLTDTFPPTIFSVSGFNPHLLFKDQTVDKNGKLLTKTLSSVGVVPVNQGGNSAQQDADPRPYSCKSGDFQANQAVLPITTFLPLLLNARHQMNILHVSGSSLFSYLCYWMMNILIKWIFRFFLLYFKLSCDIICFMLF